MLILLVDDDKLVLKEIGTILERQGYVCHYAENGLEALRQALRRPYDLILSDITMPGLDGLKFVQRIRSSEQNAATPVLMLTGLTDRGSVMKARGIGVQGYIVKPVQADDLLARVHAALA